MERQNGTGAIEISPDAVARTLASRIALYRWRAPVYQTALLRSLGRVWEPAHRKVLDVGGGTGIVAQSIKTLFPVDSVTSVDVQDRYLERLDVETRTYDGKTLPFADGQFDCVVLSNVLHHVPRDIRAQLLKECGRVAHTIYIKDHLAGTPLDHARLTMLDVIGNVPFGGMTSAAYLSRADWLDLAAQSGFRIASWQGDHYRSGVMALLFPNRLEITMKWTPVEPAS
jgi:SAM-dependent methyltransferase